MSLAYSEQVRRRYPVRMRWEALKLKLGDWKAWVLDEPVWYWDEERFELRVVLARRGYELSDAEAHRLGFVVLCDDPHCNRLDCHRWQRSYQS